MKYTENHTDRYKQIVYGMEYQLQKIKVWSKRIVRDKEERQKYIQFYEDMYKQEWWRLEEVDNSLPGELYLEPLAIFASDIMAANELDGIKSGLIRLMKRQNSSKFIGASLDLERIENIRIYEPGAFFWINIGIIDFDNVENVKDKVSHIEVKMRNLNDSYLLLDLIIYPTETEVEKMDKWMREIHCEETTKLIKGFRRKKQEETGSRYRVNKASYDGSLARLNMLEEEYLQIKRLVFDEIRKYLPIQLHMRQIVQPGFVLYKSNLNTAEKLPEEFMNSIGIWCYRLKNEDVLNANSHSFMYPIRNSKGANHYVICMDGDIEKKEMFHSKEYQLIYGFEQIYKDIGRNVLARYLYRDYRDTCLEYRTKFGNIPISRRRLNKLYALRNRYFKEINFYRMASRVEQYNRRLKKVGAGLPVISQNKIEEIHDWFADNNIEGLSEFSNVIDKEIEDKIMLCKDLSDRHQSLVSSWIAFISLVISLMALIVTMWGGK